MKTVLNYLLIAIALVLFRANATAISLSLEPTSASIEVGGSASINLVVSGLGDLTSPSLGAFDIDISYDPSLLSATSLAFGNMLDLGLFGSAQFADLSVPGLIHLDEISFESPSDLILAQPGSFTLATLQVLGVGPGLAAVDFAYASLSDENGISLDTLDLTGGSIEVRAQAVPDGGSTAAMLFGSLALSWRFRRALRH